MAILTQDIKLLKSSVMADTTDGGGQMTGTAIVDGASNNMFPDTSAMDRAFGRVNLRKIFGVAHTDDSDTLLGAHAVITDAPDDPLVHCTIMKTSNWADQRTQAKDVIERYLVKSNKLAARIYDNHYAGALTLRLYTFATGVQFPVGGDAIVIRNPNGVEQYVRVLRTTTTTQTIALAEYLNTVTASATVVECQLGQALTFDVLGVAPYRTAAAAGVTEANYAAAYATTTASGAKFYGVKPLQIAADIGDLDVTTTGGIYTPLVPAATVESALVDQYPTLAIPSITMTGSVNMSVTTASAITLGPGITLTTPTPIQPRTVALSHNGTSFTDNGKGDLIQGSTSVGTVSYRTGVVTMASTSPSYGSASPTLTYKAATSAGASVFSDARNITIANQGLVFVESLDPPPARGSFSLSYMAQGRWYVLMDDMDGKLAGADTAYGTGTLNYTTGSVSVTLGAIPDIGSAIIYQWGESTIAQPFSAALPTAIDVSVAVAPVCVPNTVVLTWTSSSAAKTATVGANRQITGDATGKLLVINGIETAVMSMTNTPDGNVNVAYSTYTPGDTAITSNGGGSFQTAEFPVQPGTLRFTVNPVATAYFTPYESAINLADDGSGNIWATPRTSVYGSRTQVGTINYSTGEISITSGISLLGSLREVHSVTSWLFWTRSYDTYTQASQSVSLGTTITNSSYTGGAGTPTNSVVAPSLRMQLPTSESNTPLNVNDIVFTMGGSMYTSKAGVLSKGWNAATGLPTTASAGSVSSSGLITIDSATGTTAVTWYNAALRLSAPTTTGGVFRTANAPLKTGVFEITDGGTASTSNESGVISGADITGTIDFTRGIVKWNTTGTRIDPSLLRYNAVFLQYLPLDPVLLGIETARLPLDGKVPIYRSGDLVVVHNTLTDTLPNPVVRDFANDLGRVRIASMRVKDVQGDVVPDTLYTADLSAGTITFPTASNLTAYTQPFTVEHRIEDMLLCSSADISGKLTFTRSLTHNFPANTSFVSSAMPFGDLFSRAYNLIEQSSWTSVWQDTIIGSAIIPQFNDSLYPIAVTNRGAIKERWVLIFTNTTSFRVIGESVGEIASGTTGVNCAPVNPATGVPYFTVPAQGWGAGWATGNCLRFNTDACGTPFWAVRTVLQGPASIDSDQFTLAFRGDVDRP